MRGRSAQLIACAAAAVGGIVLWGAFPPATETLNALVALVPLLVVARLAKPARAAGAGFAFGLAYWIPTLVWMLALTDNDGPWFAVVPGYLALAAWCAGYAALFAALDARLWRTFGSGAARFLLPFGEAILWAGCECLRARVLSGFSWNPLGMAFVPMPYFIAPAAVGGVYLVSALVVLFNGVAATLLLRVARPFLPAGSAPAPCGRFSRMAETALPLAAVLGVLWLGKACPRPARAETPLRVALVQRNASCSAQRRSRENPRTAFARLAPIAAAARPDLLLLAESDFCGFGDVRRSAALAEAADLLETTGARALVTGGDERAEGKFYNVAALYRRDGGATAFAGTYRKNHLVPFGEYIPLDKLIPALGRLSPVGVSVWPGEPALLAPFGETGLRLGALICFEDTVSPLARRAAADGAQALALITNDAWFTPDEDGLVAFLKGLETRQHVWQTVLRAVETGLPILRSGNSGVTGIVSPAGRMRLLENGDGAPLVDQPGVMTENVRPVASGACKTPYVRWGDGPLALFFLLTVACLFVPAFRAWRARHSKSNGFSN